MTAGVIAINVQETPHAYRVNGVTVAKRHLQKAFPARAHETEKLLWTYLVIVPFLHEAYNVPVKAAEHIKYCSVKAHRVFHALNLPNEAILPFMIVALKSAGDMNDEEMNQMGIGQFANLTDAFAPSNRDGADNVVPFPGSKKTLH